MATAVQVESLWNGLTDNNGEPLAAGKVFTYAAGTTTPVSLFTASDKSTSATNPLILDANGKAQVWADGRYKFVVKTAADVTLYTLDNLLYGFDDTTVLYGGTSTGSANAQVVSVPATVTSYANGQTVSFVAGFTNTGATTLKFNSLAAITLVKGPTPSSLEAGDLIAGQLYTATYHGGTFRLQDYPSVADVQRSRFAFATGVSGTNTITATLTPAPSSYETGMVVNFIAAATNTGAVTLNLNGLGAKTVQERGTALTGAELVANRPVQVVYDGTNFQIISNNLGSGTALSPALFFGDDTNTGIFSPGADRIGMSIGGTQSLEVSNNGYLGVGTGGDVSPEGLFNAGNAQLTVKGTGANGYVQLNMIARTTNSVGNQLNFCRSNGTNVGDQVVPANGNQIGAIVFHSSNGAQFRTSASIQAVVDGTPTSTSTPAFLRFWTTPVDSLTLVERMRIRSDGNVGIANVGAANTRLQVFGEDTTASNYSFATYGSTGSAASMLAVRNDGRVGIGTTSLNAKTVIAGESTTLPVLRLLGGGAGDVANRAFEIFKTDNDSTTSQNFVYFYINNGNTASGKINANGANAAAFGSTSDIRLKENIVDLPSQLDAILSLRPVEFDYKDGSGHQIGFIAQEVQEVFPDLIGEADGYLTLTDLNKNDARLIKAFQELAAKVEALEAKVQALEAATEV